MTAEATTGTSASNAGLERLEAWFVTGSQHLYGEEVLERVDENARHIARCLDEAAVQPIRIIPKPVVTTADEISAVLRDADSSPNCVGVVGWMHTFSPAKMWIAGLTNLNKPFVHLHTQFNRDLPWSTIDMDFMNLNQSAHGDREFAFIQTRLRRRRKTIVGHWADPAVATKLASWSRAAVGWHEAHLLRIARFGDNMREVAVTEGDKVEAQARLGFSVNGFGVSDLVAATGSVGESEVDDLVAAYEDAIRSGAGPPAVGRAPCGAAHRRPDRGRSPVIPHGRRLRGVHGHVRGPRWAGTAAGHRSAAADGRGLRFRRRG